MIVTRSAEHRDTRLLHAGRAGDVAEAAALIKRGGLVAFPTDTVYGLGTMAWDAQAVARIFVAKERPAEKAIPILIADLAGAGELMAGQPAGFAALAARFWPGPLTLVVAANRALPETVTGGSETVALRIPDHPGALSLLRYTGPLAVSSANRSGGDNPETAADVLAQLDGRIDAVLDGGRCPGGLPSTVVDLTRSPVRVLRSGPVSEQEILALLAAPQACDSAVRVAN